MKTRGLKAGDKVFIREDLKDRKEYQGIYYVREMGVGPKTISDVHPSGIHFIASNDNLFFHYSSEMIDWEKTMGLKINESWERINESWESVKKAIKGDGTFKEIIQYGECRNEITKATTYDGREITVKNNNEKNDIEKAVMLLMLKQCGVTYSEIKKEVEKVKIKWTPQFADTYYTISGNGEVTKTLYLNNTSDTVRISINNCFETRKEAEEKLEKIKEVLRGDYDGK